MPSIAQVLLCVILLSISYSCAPTQYKAQNYSGITSTSVQQPVAVRIQSCQIDVVGLGYTNPDPHVLGFSPENSSILHQDNKSRMGFAVIAHGGSSENINIIIKISSSYGVKENIGSFKAGKKTSIDLKKAGVDGEGKYTIELFCASDRKLLVKTDFEVVNAVAKNENQSTDSEIQQKIIEQMFGGQLDKTNSASNGSRLNSDKYSSNTDYIFHPPLNGASGEYFRWTGRLLKKVGDYYLVYVNNPMAQMVNASLVGTPFYSGQTDEGAFAFKLSANNKTILLQDKRITVSGQFTDCVVMLNGRNIPLLTDAIVE